MTTLDELMASSPAPTRPKYKVNTAAVVAACASLISAGIHLYVVPTYREKWWVYAAFFVTLAIGQVVSAALVLWWRRNLVLVGVVGANVGVVILWVVSRTNGLPFGPPIPDFTAGLADPSRGGYGEHAVGVPEPVGRLDVTATLLELIVIFAVCSMLPTAWRRPVINTLL